MHLGYLGRDCFPLFSNLRPALEFRASVPLGRRDSSGMSTPRVLAIPKDNWEKRPNDRGVSQTCSKLTESEKRDLRILYSRELFLRSFDLKFSSVSLLYGSS